MAGSKNMSANENTCRYWSAKDGTVTEVDPVDENAMEVIKGEVKDEE